MMSGDPSTGIKGLDQIFRGLRLGDNVVFNVDAIEHYAFLVRPYVSASIETSRKLIYFRFGDHPPLTEPQPGIEIQTLEPAQGFESFVGALHSAIEKAGRGAFYVFDCLSTLSAEWYSDEMLGNCFLLTCPYLYDMETVAYFGLLRNRHSDHATKPITETAQVVSDVFQEDGRVFILPSKVQQRYSPTMHMLHEIDGQDLHAVNDSITVARVMGPVAKTGLVSAADQMDAWTREFLDAERDLEKASAEKGDKAHPSAGFQRLTRMTISRDEKIVVLAEKYLGAEDILQVGRRMVGTGLIGGKAVGMLLAHAILRQADPRFEQRIETHDSFYIGSDVYYTFLVRNGCWWIRSRPHTVEAMIEEAERSRRRILTGNFPDYIERQFGDMLDYFGQSPIIVRSSSLLEDNFGNSFVGKYESIFCPNQGLRSERMADFLAAVRTVYASSLSEKAIRYRARRGILHLEERMGLLVQRVSGKHYGRLFYPEMAGVGYSCNPYVWSSDIDSAAGVVRLVFGLGTRAVDRSEDDYTRVVALDNPLRRPEADYGEKKRYTQHNCDVLDLNANQIESMQFSEVVERSPGLPLDLFASRDHMLERMVQKMGRKDVFTWDISFGKLFTETPFVKDLREMLHCLQEAYGCPVDIEFTANSVGEKDYKINLVQCRPLLVREGGPASEPPADLSSDDVVLKSREGIVGHSRKAVVDRVVYVLPWQYNQLSGSERVNVARVLGQLMHLEEARPPECTMLLGPGRWGTSIPSLGVPVRFSEINKVSILCEVVPVQELYAPQVSLGTHFFSELVEMDILYFAIFPYREETLMRDEFWEQSPNSLAHVLPEAREWEAVIKVIDLREPTERGRLILCANTLKQLVMCYWDK